MIFTQTCRSTLVAATLAASAALTITSEARADFVAAPLHFSISVSSGSGFMFSQSYEADTKMDFGNGQFAYEIFNINNSTFQFTPATFTIGNGSPSATLPAGIFTGFNFQNKATENLQVTVTYLLETSFSPSAGVVDWETHVSMAVSGNTLLSTIPGSPFWQAAVDGAPVANVFPHPNQLFGSGGAASADQSADGTVLAPTSSISITMTFDINAGGQASYNGNFTVVPTPGSLALLAIGGLVAVGRRRRVPAA